jgi:opacity protein-like surface antigen
MKFLRRLSIGLIALAFASSAHAADMTVKVAPAASDPGCTSTYCVGPFLDLGVDETGGSFNIASQGLNGLADNNFNAFIGAGFDYWNGTIYLGLEGVGEYGLISNGVIPGGGNSALWGAGVWAKIGYNVAQNIFGITATNSPSLGNLVANSVPYINLGEFTRPWGTGFLSGVGVEGWIAKNWSIHADWNYVNYNNANINPNVKEQSESQVRGGITYHFSL